MKLLIAEACLVILVGTETTVHADVGQTVDVSKDDANYLTRAGRAFYTSRDDDPTKGKLTANDEDRKRITKVAASLKESQAQAQSAQQPTDFASMLQAGIAQGLAEGMKAIQAMQAGAQPAASGSKS
jgi:hypothetical protein